MDPIEVVDMHTGGEPVRIVTAGYPAIPPGPILRKRAFVRDNLDHLRRILMHEPRGHADMYGALLVEPELPGADMAVLFMHNEGYSTMCGHAVIALGRYAVDRGLVAAGSAEAIVRIECPCGLVETKVEIAEGRTGLVSFESVPAFLFDRFERLTVDGHGPVDCDLAYGGAYYAIAEAADFGLSFGRSPLRGFLDAAAALAAAAGRAATLTHPDDPDLAFLYGVILTDGLDGAAGRPSRNVCIFADGQVDRSPTGSGVTARLAAMHAQGLATVGTQHVFESLTGARFTGAITRKDCAGPHEAVRVRVGGRAHYSGTARFTVEADDPLGGGFLLR